MSPIDRPHRRLTASLSVLALLTALAACGPGGSAGQSSAQTKGGKVQLQVVSKNGNTLALAPVYVAGKGPFPFIVDTGASSSVLDVDTAKKLGLPVEKTEQKVTGVSCRTTVSRVNVKKWRVGDITLRPQDMTSTDIPDPTKGAGVAGLLGSDVLSNYGSVTIDYSAEQLTLS